MRVGSDPDQLPILQHALARMWKHAAKRNSAEPRVGWDELHTDEVGGIREALSRHADRVFKSLSPDLIRSRAHSTYDPRVFVVSKNPRIIGLF